MRSKVVERMLATTPEDVKIFVEKYADIVLRVNDLLKEKGWTQKDLAQRMDKTQSEVSKWLNGEHNLTLRSIAKLEAELGAPILYVPQTVATTSASGINVNFTIYRNDLQSKNFLPVKPEIITENRLAHAI